MKTAVRGSAQLQSAKWNMTCPDPKDRFSDRVENYQKYRPGYPAAIVDCLAADFGLKPTSVVADVGCGTGLLSELFLKNGNRVIGIEPNQAMRKAGETFLATYEGFLSIDASAEATTLEPQSVDYVTAGQAFHWFDRAEVKREFRRILKPEGRIVLIWNDRRTDSTAFLKDYENFLVVHGVDYKEVDHKNIDDDEIRLFFRQTEFQKLTFKNSQKLDYNGLEGRGLSSSYIPTPGHPKYEKMITALVTLFRQHEKGGLVEIEYDTKVYVGQLTE